MGWWYLGSSGASGGVLLMWDTLVVDKVEGVCVGRYTIACSMRNVDDKFVWAFKGCTTRMMMLKGGVYGMSWLT